MCICDWLTSIKLLWQENNWTHGGRGRPCPVHPCSEPSQLHKNCHIHTTILHEFATIVDIAWTDGQRFYIINNFLGTKIIVISFDKSVSYQFVSIFGLLVRGPIIASPRPKLTHSLMLLRFDWYDLSGWYNQNLGLFLHSQELCDFFTLTTS